MIFQVEYFVFDESNHGLIAHRKRQVQAESRQEVTDILKNKEPNKISNIRRIYE